MIIYVDIDETICESPPDRDYLKAIPIKENIKKINELYYNNHTIVYWTARGSQTGIDWADITRKQIKDWGAKCHEVRLAKPHYDVFICDKAINSNVFFNSNHKITDLLKDKRWMGE
tara:strand:+ start:23460 stop:23807 length:348 start_codon:yes stop_codon:yes gene_type:complete